MLTIHVQRTDYLKDLPDRARLSLTLDLRNLPSTSPLDSPDPRPSISTRHPHCHRRGCNSCLGHTCRYLDDELNHDTCFMHGAAGWDRDTSCLFPRRFRTAGIPLDPDIESFYAAMAPNAGQSRTSLSPPLSPPLLAPYSAITEACTKLGGNNVHSYQLAAIGQLSRLKLLRRACRRSARRLSQNIPGTGRSAEALGFVNGQTRESPNSPAHFAI